MDPSWPGYPIYLPWYWTYDVKVFMRIAEFMYEDSIYNSVFPVPYYWAKDYAVPLSHKLRLLNALLVAINQGYDEWQSEFLELSQVVQDLDNGSYINSWTAMEFLEFYSLRLLYEQHDVRLTYVSEQGVSRRTDGSEEHFFEVRLSRMLQDGTSLILRTASNTEIVLIEGANKTYTGRVIFQFNEPRTYSLHIHNSSREYQVGASFTLRRTPLEDDPVFRGVSYLVPVSLLATAIFFFLLSLKPKSTD